MQSAIIDAEVLWKVHPRSFVKYAFRSGWVEGGTYGQNAEVYTGDGLPDLIIPRTKWLGDYRSVVSQLIALIADAADSDERLLCDALLGDSEAEYVKDGFPSHYLLMDLGTGLPGEGVCVCGSRALWKKTRSYTWDWYCPTITWVIKPLRRIYIQEDWITQTLSHRKEHLSHCVYPIEHYSGHVEQCEQRRTSGEREDYRPEHWRIVR